jgi:serine/threonine protein kinase
VGTDSQSKPSAGQSSSKPSADEGTVANGDSVADGDAERAAQPLPEQFGRYRIVRLLGEGAMGKVYLAHDDQLDRDIALKVPRFSAKGDDERIERFYREARAAATLRHPNVCPIHDVGEFEGRPFLTMAYIEGRPLSDFVREGKPLPQRQAAIIVRKLARALAAAHKEDVTHRDLKPANVMIDERNEPIVMDFGLAQRERDNEPQLTKAGTLLGTPAYMPPEQVIGDAELIGPPADIYSLGVVLYELLTGELPFQGPVNIVLAQVLNVEPPPPSELRPGLDPELEAICQQAMAKTIEKRIPSMDELDKALTAYLRKGRSSTGKMTVVGIALDKPTQAGTQTDLEPKQPADIEASVSTPGNWFRKHWRWLAGGATAIILGLFLAFAAFEPAPQNDQSGIDDDSNWTDLTKYPLSKARFLFFKDKTWFAINSLPYVDVKYHANISAHCKQHSRNGKWIVICPYSEQPAEIVYRFNEPVYGFRATVALMHPTGHVGLRVYADGTLIHETKELLGSDGEKQIVAEVNAFTELRIEVENCGVAADNQLLIADPEVFTDPEAIPKPIVDSRQTGQCLQIWQHTFAVTDLVFSPDNRFLISGHKSGAVLAWDLETGTELKRFDGHTFNVTRLAISPDGRFAASYSDDRTIRLWRLPETGNPTNEKKGVRGKRIRENGAKRIRENGEKRVRGNAQSRSAD